MHVEHMSLFSCPLFNLDILAPPRPPRDYCEFTAYKWFSLSFSNIDCLALVYSENNLLSSYPVTTSFYMLHNELFVMIHIRKKSK